MVGTALTEPPNNFTDAGFMAIPTVLSPSVRNSILKLTSNYLSCTQRLRKCWAYLEEECHIQVVEMWECKWQKLKKIEPAFWQYVSETFKRLKPSYRKRFTQN